MASERQPNLIIVEDEEALAQGLRFNLERKGYLVEVATDGEQALVALEKGRFDLVILDVRLPEMDGFEVCTELRRRNDFTPVLMLTARSQPDDVVFGLRCGADDYVVKPFDLAELLARVEVLLRRTQWTEENGNRPSQEIVPPRLEFGDYWVDFSSWQAKTRQGVVELSQKEMEVMRIFAERPNEVISRRQLLARVWDLPNHPNTRVVDNVIVVLRKAFEESAWRPRHIHSVRGVGYRFVP
ncbi:MAG: response regulator transcription factor [Deltaproteobacteria bacterium]|nr:response regulator transcription factor [Deltaproteobacteria bacterium]